MLVCVCMRANISAATTEDFGSCRDSGSSGLFPALGKRREQMYLQTCYRMMLGMCV